MSGGMTGRRSPQKNARTRERNATKKEENIKKMGEMWTSWRSLSAAQQLDKLDVRLGNGQGAIRQRGRLAKLLSN